MFSCFFSPLFFFNPLFGYDSVVSFFFIMMVRPVSFFLFDPLETGGKKGMGKRKRKKKSKHFFLLTQNLPNGMALCVIRIPESVYFHPSALFLS